MAGLIPVANVVVVLQGGVCIPCFVTVYVDGIRVYESNAMTSAEEPPDAYHVANRDLAGVEFYPDGGVAPPEYNKTGSGCGILLLWTRER